MGRGTRSRLRRGQGRKENIFSIWKCESKVVLQTQGGRGQRGRWVLAVVFIQNGGEGEKMNKNESSPIQLGEGTSTLRQGFIQEGWSPSLD